MRRATCVVLPSGHGNSYSGIRFKPDYKERRKWKLRYSGQIKIQPTFKGSGYVGINECTKSYSVITGHSF